MNSKMIALLALLILSSMSFGTKLEMNSDLKNLFDVLKSGDHNKIGKLTSINPQKRPKAFKVVKARFSERSIQRLASSMNITFDKEEHLNKVRLFKKDNSVLGFDEKNGNYFFHRTPSIKKPLKHASSKNLKLLRKAADIKLVKLLGEESKNFVFSNDETHWYQTKDNPEPRIRGKSYRYIRMLDGRRVIDNTAWVRISFSGDNEMSEFEIVNPSFEPLEIQNVAKVSSSEERLFSKVEKIKKVRKGRKHVGVSRVVAQKSVETYISKRKGDEEVLVPHLSFWSEYNLENGDSFKRYINLSLDADHTPNLPDEMQEEIYRR